MLRGHRDLRVYQSAYALAMEIFHLSRTFPREEVYSLTNQIRRSSRSVAANLAEGFRKRRYPNMLVNKLTDCDGEARKLKCGLISLLTVGTFLRKTTIILLPDTKRWGECYPT
jgi:four helix bundle protein